MRTPCRAQVLENPVTISVEIIGSPSVTAIGSGYMSAGMAINNESAATTNNPELGPSGIQDMVIRTQMTPGKDCALTLAADNCSGDYKIYVNPPPGYSIYIDDIRRRGVSFSGSPLSPPPSVILRLDDQVSLGAGESTSLRPQRIVWSVGLGSLKNGSPAGAISMRQLGLSATVFSRAALFCGNASAEVQRIYDNSGFLRQVFANSCLVNITTLPSGSEGFLLSFYNRGDIGTTQEAIGNGDNILIWSLNSGALPFTEYKFENPTPGTYNKVRITKSCRLNSSGSSTPKVWTTELRQISGQPAGQEMWAVVDWTDHTVSGTSDLMPGDSWSKWTYTDNGLTEKIDVLDGVGAIATTTTNKYYDYPWGAELKQSITDETTVYEYYTDTMTPGAYSRIKNIGKPTAGTIEYQYYEDINRRGELKQMTQPWLEGPPASLPLTTVYDYSQDVTGFRKSRPQSIVKSIGNSVVAKATIDYADIPVTESVTKGGTVYTPTRYLLQATRKDWPAASLSPLVSVSSVYREDAGMGLLPGTTAPDGYEVTRGYLPGLPYSSTAIDGTKSKWTYTRGVFSNSQRMLTPLAEGSDWAVREERLGPSGPVDGGSTFKTSVYTFFGLPIAWESGLYFQGAWHTTERRTRTYQQFLIPSSVFSDNGENPYNNWPAGSSTWEGGLLIGSSDINGGEREYRYTSSGWKRAVGIKQKGGVPSGEQWTVFGYDGSHRTTSVRQQVSDQSESAEDLWTSSSYNTFGRLASVLERGPGSIIQTDVNYAFGSFEPGYPFPFLTGLSVKNTSVATGAFSIREKYKDGRVKGESGTALYGSYYGFNTLKSYGYAFGSTGLSVTVSLTGGGYTYSLSDWLGRPLCVTTPAYDGLRIAEVFT